MKKDKTDFRRLELELLQECPSFESPEFIRGYHEFVTNFMETFISLSDIFYDYAAGICEIDIDFILYDLNSSLEFQNTNARFKNGAELGK